MFSRYLPENLSKTIFDFKRDINQSKTGHFLCGYQAITGDPRNEHPIHRNISKPDFHLSRTLGI